MNFAIASILLALARESTNGIISFDVLQGKRILVVGGSGRVGGSVVTQLIKRGSAVVVAGTSEKRFLKAKTRWQAVFPTYASKLREISFAKVDRERAESMSGAIENYDLVVHTAGPFQGKAASPNGVLEACIDWGVPYLDVCDDYCTASAAKTKYAASARSPCIISTGTWPGVSSLIAKRLVSEALAKNPKLTTADFSVDFGFFTAGA
jgi:saccharopine dehydrogenase-like NADP-dependent oxidoreductase